MTKSREQNFAFNALLYITSFPHLPPNFSSQKKVIEKIKNEKKKNLYLPQWKPEHGLCTTSIKIILAVINTGTMYYQITQYTSDSDQGWTKNCISIAITKVHEIEVVLASSQLWKDRWHLSQYKAWLIQINQINHQNCLKKFQSSAPAWPESMHCFMWQVT